MLPKRLHLRNFLSHDKTEIDFSKFDIALILGSFNGNLDQSNGVGKTGLLEGITWSLFGKSRHKKKDGVVKWDRKDCEVVFEFFVDNILFCVSRSRDKTVGESDITFEQWNEAKNAFDDISCDNNTATDEKIISTIGFNYDVFVNSVYFKQNDISMFATTTPTKRKDIIKSLLKIDQWDEYQKKTKEHTKSLQNKIDEKTERLIPIDTIRKNIETFKNKSDIIKAQIKECNQEYSTINSTYISKKLQYQSVYGNIGNDEIEFKRLQNEFSIAKKRVGEISLQKESNARNIKSSSGQVSTLQQKISALKNTISAGKGIQLEDIRNKLIIGHTKEKLLKERISQLERDLNLGDECELCRKPLNKKEKEEIKERHVKELKETKIQHTEIQQKLSKANEKLKEKETAVIEATRAELEKSKIELRLNKLQSVISESAASNERLDVEYRALISRDFKSDLEALKVRFNKSEEEKVKAEIQQLELQLQDLKKKTDKLNFDYGINVSHKNELIKSEQEQVDLQKEIDRIKGEFLVYDKLKDYFGKDGIQAVIIENVIEELENYSNETLNKICNEPTKISILTQKQTDNGSWQETFDINVKEGNRTDDFDALSGGGQFRISLALRLALSNILSKRMGGTVQMILMDEVSSSLDRKGKEMFMGVVKKLGKDMKILIISHDEQLKEYFSNIIVVDKTQAGSKAVLQ